MASVQGENMYLASSPAIANLCHSLITLPHNCSKAPPVMNTQLSHPYTHFILPSSDTTLHVTHIQHMRLRTEISVAIKKGSYEVGLSSLCNDEFQYKTYTEASSLLIMQVQELS